ncbi:polysaccharide pyruvyl transferase family protein [Paraburkholderia sp. B3]|uniref:polysaccharide pyruvyl transferase family protein n=1 Tax=Paraburkholderia sp. B3 TaxID=3134791 RepID=UPI003981CF10
MDDDDPVRRSYRALHRYASAAQPDEVFLDDMQARIDAAHRGRAGHDEARRASDGRALRVLLLGYTGAGNTGADLRTIETIAQLRRLFAPREVALTLFALGNCFDHPLLAATPKFVPSLPYLPDALDAAIRDADVVLNVEGSTYTSKFSDSLAGVLVGGIALARAHGRPALAYGVDSGAMSEALTRFVRRNASHGARVICRNDAACTQLDALGVSTTRGSDTAWTWRAPAPPRADGAARIAVLCPNNPCWWPVRADAARARALDASGGTSPHRYGPLHFQSWDAQRATAYDAYLDRYAAIAAGLRQRGYTPVLVGMERLDSAACADVAARVPFAIDRVVRGAHALDAVAATVAHAHCVVTTRYHAAVLAMSHGVPVFGLSMDARIDRLLDEAGCGEWHARCDADDAVRRCLARIEMLEQGTLRTALADALDRYARAERMRFDEMGAQVVEAVSDLA